MEKSWGLNEDKPIATLMERMAAAGGNEVGASGMAYPIYVIITCLAPRRQVFSQLLTLGISIQRAVSCKGKCSWPMRKNELSFRVNRLINVTKALNIFGTHRDFPASLTLARGRKTTLEHGSSFLKTFFFLNMEPEITFSSYSIDGRKGHFFARNIPFIADRRVDGLTYQ